MSDYQISVEKWTSALGDEITALAAAHFDEVDGGVEPNRPYNLSFPLMQALQDADAIVLLIARRYGEIVGYLNWQITPDVESAGLIIAQQGAWYVVPGCPFVAIHLFDTSLQVLKERGVDCAFPHHRMQGRGAGLGKFFRRRGAKKIQETYSLWLGGGDTCQA